MRAILAYSNAALPETADEGQSFINITTEETLIFHNGKWESLTAETPSPVAEVLSEEPVVEKPAETKPKAASSKKKTTKKESK